MEQRRAARGSDSNRIRAKLEFMGLADSEPPELILEAIDPSGQRLPMSITRTGEIDLDATLVGKGFALELRPPDGGSPRRFGYDAFAAQLQKEGLYRIPEPTWSGWLRFETCVTGKVRVCSHPFPWAERLELSTLVARTGVAAVAERLQESFWPPHLSICHPVCNGKVEVLVRTCCCPAPPPPVIIKDICEIIDCPPGPIPHHWPDLEPGPIGPRPGPGPDPVFDRAVQRALKRAEADEGAPPAETVLRLAQHALTLQQLPLADQIQYIGATPELRYWHCQCSTTKVAEVPLHSDGHFDACFWDGPYALSGCTRRVQYRVLQWQGSGWLTVYDGPARGESFELGDDADLRAEPGTQACDNPITPPSGMVPFVLLEQIGTTWADTLIHSTLQTGETEFGLPLAAIDGLANKAPMGANLIAGPYNQPWGTTLNLRYQFHPGLAALGAKYFRTRVIRVGDNGKPLLTEPVNFPITGNVAWSKYYGPAGGGVGVESVQLSNPIINGVEGLYTIPYPDLVWPWLGGQWHAFVVTTEMAGGAARMPNGRYLLIVDIYNSAGHRLVPIGVPGAVLGEVAAAFEYRRLDGPIDAPFSNTSVVPHTALANLFYVDNLACYADIEQIVHGGTASATNCQFLEGAAADNFHLKYSAYQDTGFQWYHYIKYKQGLTGPETLLAANNTNVKHGASPVLTFSELLGAETACAFASTLLIMSRHTNGFGRISGYDREDTAAFALSIKPVVPMP